MADCFLRTFDPNGEPDYQKSWADKLIGLRSKYTHSEIQFSARYNGISASSTMKDDCRCFRFKMIDYSKHPTRWKTQVVPLTDAQEDAILLESLKMSGILHKTATCLCQLRTGKLELITNSKYGTIFHGLKASKYDLLGVSFSFILPKWRIWRPHHKWVWCSESCCILLKVVFKDFISDKRCDEQSPERLYSEWDKYNARNKVQGVGA